MEEGTGLHHVVLTAPRIASHPDYNNITRVKAMHQLNTNQSKIYFLRCYCTDHELIIFIPKPRVHFEFFNVGLSG